MWSPVISNIQPLWKPAALLAEVSLSKTFDSSSCSLFGNWPWLPTSVDLDNDIHLFIIPWGIVLFVQLILFVIMNVWICFVWRSGGVCGCSKRHSDTQSQSPHEWTYLCFSVIRAQWSFQSIQLHSSTLVQLFWRRCFILLDLLQKWLCFHLYTIDLNSSVLQSYRLIRSRNMLICEHPHKSEIL